MKRLFTPAFIGVFCVFAAQAAAKAAAIFRSSVQVFPGEFIKPPLASMLAIAAADTISIVSILAAFVAFATFFVNYVTAFETRRKEADRP
jgi:hypothetical protein